MDIEEDSPAVRRGAPFYIFSNLMGERKGLQIDTSKSYKEILEEVGNAFEVQADKIQLRMGALVFTPKNYREMFREALVGSVIFVRVFP